MIFAARGEKRRDSNASSASVEKRLAVEKVPSNLPESRPASANSGPIIPPTSLPPTPTAIANSVGSVSYNLGHIGVSGGNAIAAAASQAIAATQHMQQGRRTASLKASYEAINIGVHASEFSRELAGAAQTAIAAIQETTKKHKKSESQENQLETPILHSIIKKRLKFFSSVFFGFYRKVTTAAPSSSVVSAAIQQPASPPVATATVAITDPDNPEWTYDPNEPRYCICNQVSYGDMVACDNSDVSFNYFHSFSVRKTKNMFLIVEQIYSLVRQVYVHGNNINNYYSSSLVPYRTSKEFQQRQSNFLFILY